KPVITKACPYEPDVNPSFAQMASHFGVAIIPARVKRPKDKAAVESAVGFATRVILAVLRNRTFFSLAEANEAVQVLL
ncbi:IS21 family transposase, partial [Acinetobacter baumannii]